MLAVCAWGRGSCRASGITTGFALALLLSAFVPATAGDAPGKSAARPAHAAPAPSAPQPVRAAHAAHRTDALHGTRTRTRFVIVLEKAVDFQVQALSGNRVTVDLPDVAMVLPTIGGDEPVGLVRSFRGGLAATNKMRVIIDVTEPVVIEKSDMQPAADGHPARLVLDLVPVEAQKHAKRPLGDTPPSGAGLADVMPPVPRRAERPAVRDARSYKPVIVLDPGHGGHDGGANRNGAIEKDVVLAFGLALNEKLKGSGRYKVLMTRESDVFVPLHERREFAERHQAALFIAIHADYAGSSARGATIYSLREGVANELRRAANREVASNVLNDREIKALKTGDEGDIGAVKGILADLAQREVLATKERTSVFSRSVIEYMGASTNMMSNPERGAAFAVLRTAKVPAVLIELAYVSNKQDAAQLKSDEWRGKVSSSIMTAIDNYFSHQLARLPM